MRSGTKEISEGEYKAPNRIRLMATVVSPMLAYLRVDFISRHTLALETVASAATYFLQAQTPAS